MGAKRNSASAGYSFQERLNYLYFSRKTMIHLAESFLNILTEFGISMT